VLRDVLFVKENLALEIIQLDVVSIGDHQMTHASPTEVIGQPGAERAAANDSHAGPAQRLLACFPDRGK
jgi:hypothetical protein